MLKLNDKVIMSDSWIIILDEIAIKLIDKSFLKYNESGIPKDIRGYFEIKDLKKRDSIDIKLKFNNIEYKALLNMAVDSRSKIRWSKELGEVLRYKFQIKDDELDNWINKNNYKIIFRKIGTDIYDISMDR
ncbi:MAG: hypothetical protein RSB70_05790 [Clostridium sp.]